MSLLIALSSLPSLHAQDDSPKLLPEAASGTAEAEEAPLGSVVRGRVSGQDEAGNFLGTVSGATVEILAPDGSTIGQATTNETGFYEIPGLDAGSYNYRVTAPNFNPDDVERGFELTSAADAHVFNVILTQGGGEDEAMGTLEGKVTYDENGTRTPAAGIVVSARAVGAPRLITGKTQEDGTYALEVSTGDWQVSARILGSEAVVNPGSVKVMATRPATVDFVLTKESEMNSSEVYVLVSVPSEEEAKPPIVHFVEAESNQVHPAEVLLLEGAKLAEIGLDQDDLSGSIRWYSGEPAEPLSNGEYFVEGEVEGLVRETSAAKPLNPVGITWFDLDLVSENFDPENPDPVEMTETTPGLRGRVTGQSDRGEYLGVIAGAVVELMGDSGEVAASATTNEFGYYEILEVGAGEWEYRITSSEYDDDDFGRGLILNEGSEIQTFNFVLTTEIAEASEPGIIKGQVWTTTEGGKNPVAGARVNLASDSGALTTVRTDAEGTYELEVPPDTWRISAMTSRFDAKVHDSPIVVAEADEAVVDFTFNEDDYHVIPPIEEVYALVGVDIDPENTESSPPAVFFTSVDGSMRVPGTVERIDEETLAEMGAGSAFGPRLTDWYEAKPSEHLSAGQYRAEAELSGYMPDMTELKSVGQDLFVSYDLELLLPFSEDDPVEPMDLTGTSRLYGRVSGQTNTGEYEGVVGNARVELYSTSRQLIASALTNRSGFYEVGDLAAGEYLYRITGDPYDPDDYERGFILPSDTEAYQHNFILTRHVEDEPDPEPVGTGMISGTVTYVDPESGETGVPFAKVSVVDEMGTLFHVITSESGDYSFELAASNWRVAAIAPDFEPHVHPESVTVTPGSEEKIDFTFSGTPILPADVFILTAVERHPDESDAIPDVILYEVTDDGSEPAPVELAMERLGTSLENSEILSELGMSLAEPMEGSWEYFLMYPADGGVAPGLYAAAGFLDDNYAPIQIEPRSVHAGLPTMIDVILEKIRPEVLVNVTGSKGQPIPEASVTLVNRTAGESLADAPTLRTDDAGQVMRELNGGFGSYNVMVNLDGYQSYVAEHSIEPGSATVNVQLSALPEVLVTVACGSEKLLLSGVQLQFVNKTRNHSIAQALDATTDDRGIGSLILPDGFADYSLVASLSDYRPHVQELTVAEEVVSLDIKMYPAGAPRPVDFTGIVVEKPAGQTLASVDGKKVPNAMIEFHPVPGQTLPPMLSSRFVSDTIGQFSANEALEGSYKIAVAADGYQVYTGDIDITFGMEPAVIPLEKRSASENWIKMILTQGWGDLTQSVDFHKMGVQEDPNNGNVDYALGLSALQANDTTTPVTAFTNAVKKQRSDMWWDRACEGYIWSLMDIDQPQRAASEIRAMVTGHFQNRDVTDAAIDAAQIFGVAVGVMNGPWNTEASRMANAKLDQDCVAALCEPLRAAYIRGRDGVSGTYSDLTKAGEAEKKEIADAAAAKRRQLEQTAGKRMEELKGLMATNQAEQDELTRNWNREKTRLMAEADNLRAMAGPIQQQLMAAQQNQNMVQPVGCEVCGRFNPTCAECAKATKRSQRQQERGMITGGVETMALRNQLQEFENTLNRLQADYDQKEALYRQQIANLVQAHNRLVTEYNGLGGQMAMAPDPNAAIAEAGKESEEKKRSFRTYHTYPIDLRKQELLGFVNRKAELPTDISALDTGALPPPLPSSDTGATPPPLPGSGGMLPPPLPSENTPPPLPR